MFFLSVPPAADIGDLLTWADAHLAQQRPEFAARFRPVLEGLRRTAQGLSIEEDGSGAVRRFFGRANGKHRLLN